MAVNNYFGFNHPYSHPTLQHMSSDYSLALSDHYAKATTCTLLSAMNVPQKKPKTSIV